jgi:type II secretory pathway pseudopilin PulG
MKEKFVLISDYGQTLIEVVIATGIIVVVLVGCLSLAAMNIRVGTLTRQKNQAINLASQGMEGIRNIRDTYWLEGDDKDDQWQAFLDEYFNNGLVGEFNIQYDETEGKWKKKTDFTEQIEYFIFQRRIILENTEIDSKKKVRVTASWDNGAKKIENISYLTNWRQ